MPYGSFKHVLVTSEFSPLEPQTEQKYYVPGVGEAAERVVKGTTRIPAGQRDALSTPAERASGHDAGVPYTAGRWQPCSAWFR